LTVNEPTPEVPTSPVPAWEPKAPTEEILNPASSPLHPPSSNPFKTNSMPFG